jgi:hypothetical protein
MPVFVISLERQSFSATLHDLTTTFLLGFLNAVVTSCLRGTFNYSRADMNARSFGAERAASVSESDVWS